MLYCLAIEYACHGDLSTHLHRAGKGFSETAARREIAGILDVLGKLHRGQMLHRDLTPLNVFVCDRRTLKLGDFGIARPADRSPRRHRADAESVCRAERHPGRRRAQVAGARRRLPGGAAARHAACAATRARVCARSTCAHLPCSDHLKEIIYRCIGERRKRYESADHLIDALRNPSAALKSGALRSLRGVHLAFTGILSKPRRDAVAAAKKAGAVVHGGPSVRTTALVRGRPNPQQAAGRDAGLKLMEIKRLAVAGHRIQLLSEAQFWRLASLKR